MQGVIDMDRWIYYNPNPIHNRVGDCTVRAICKAMDQEWEQTFAALTAYGFMMCDMPSANNVWGRYLKKSGFSRYLVNDHGKDIYTVKDFCVDNPSGTFILAIDGHVVCVKDGYYYDTWDSGQEEPVYYWTKGE